jgi:hypothetical protein
MLRQKNWFIANIGFWIAGFSHPFGMIAFLYVLSHLIVISGNGLKAGVIDRF